MCLCSSEVHERISKIDRLRKRYEIFTVAMAPPEGEEEHSQAYYVIKVSLEQTSKSPSTVIIATAIDHAPLSISGTVVLMWANWPRLACYSVGQLSHIVYTQTGQLPRYDPIQAAQERDELQRKGDEYDNKIRKAEKEIRYLSSIVHCAVYIYM